MRRLCERRSPVAQPFRPSGSRSFRLERAAGETRGNRGGARWQPLRISGRAEEGGWLTWKALFTCHRLRDYYESLFPHESESLRVHAFHFIDRAVFQTGVSIDATHWREYLSDSSSPLLVLQLVERVQRVISFLSFFFIIFTINFANQSHHARFSYNN